MALSLFSRVPVPTLVRHGGGGGVELWSCGASGWERAARDGRGVSRVSQSSESSVKSQSSQSSRVVKKSRRRRMIKSGGNAPELGITPPMAET